MERWEKEYLDIIAREKNDARLAGDLSTQLKHGKRKGIAIVLYCFVLIIVFFAAMSIGLWFFTGEEPSRKNIATGESLTKSKIESSGSSSNASNPTKVNPDQTYIDGYGFNNMMSALNACISIENEVMEACNTSNLELSSSTIQTLRVKVSEGKETLENLAFHESYTDTVQSRYDALCLCDEVLVLMQQNASFDTIYAVYSQIDGANDKSREALLTAFEANGVEHIVKSNGDISYHYQQY